VPPLVDMTAVEEQFRRLLLRRGLKIRTIEGDGNCLFRAISDQIYGGDQTYHAMIRGACMDYIESEREFFE
jgi:OTU-like cysteine protease